MALDLPSPGWREALNFWNSLNEDFIPDYHLERPLFHSDGFRNPIPCKATSSTVINTTHIVNSFILPRAINAQEYTSHMYTAIAVTACAEEPKTHAKAACHISAHNLSSKLVTLSMAVLNAHSLVKHCVEIADLIVMENVDLLAVTETWLHKAANHTALLACPENFGILRCDRATSVGGGVALLSKADWKMHAVQCDSIEHCESLLAKIAINPHESITILTVYRPPQSMPAFEDQLLGIVTLHLKPNSKMLIVGDFNLWANDPKDAAASSLLATLTSMGFVMHVSVPTQVHGNTLDWVLSHNVDIDNIQVTPCIWSDHHFIKFNIKVPSRVIDNTKKTKVQFRDLKRITPTQFSEEVVKNMKDYPLSQQINIFAGQFRDALNGATNVLAPLKTKMVLNTCKSKSQSWFSNQVITARTLKRTAEVQWRRHPNESTKELYKLAAANYKQAIITAKANHYNKRIQAAASDARELFRTVKELEGRQTLSNPEQVDDKWCQNIQDALFCKVEKHMEAIQTKLAAINRAFEQKSPREINPNMSKIPKFTFRQVTEEEVIVVVKAMKPTSFKDDLFSAVIIQDSITSLAPYIAHLVNSSFLEATVPGCLKESIITPLLKKPSLDAGCPLNYRPVTNVSFLLKILDRFAYIQILEFLEFHNLLHYGQSGFRRKHGTETALLDLKNNLSQIIDEGRPVLLMLLDLSAAFDLVSHSLLIDRLKDLFCFSDEAANWVASFLDDRSTRVMLGSASAAPVPLTRGVPQGACISPTLYNLYTRPLFDVLESIGVGFTNYADDTQLFIPLSGDYTKDVTHIQSIYAVIQEWMATNQLALNGEKTELMIVGSRQRISKLPDTYHSFTIEGTKIKVVTEVKTLGVVLDSQLTMSKHALHLKSTCSYVLKLVQQLKPYLSKQNLTRVTGALVHSRLDYCNSLMAGSDGKVISILQVIQNNAVRTVSGVAKREHITTFRRDLHWLPIKQRITHKVASITHNCLLRQAPGYLIKHINVATPARTLRSNIEYKLVVPRHKLTRFGGRAFYCYAPTLWNQIPVQIRSLPSREAFKRALKTYLFDLT